MQCGEPHTTALVYLLADFYAREGNFVALLEHAQRPWNLAHPTSPCCLIRRVLLYLEESPDLVAETVAAGALEFAAQALEEYPACARPAATRYLALAGGGDRVRRALQTGALPHLLTYMKDIAKRCDTPSAGVMSQEDFEWLVATKALMNLAGSVDGPPPHPAGRTRGTPQPQVVEEFVRAGLPRLYLTRAVTLARHAHALAGTPEAAELEDWLPQQLRLLGHAFRACVLLASTPKKTDGRLLMTLVAALRANADVGQLQSWALRYCFLPLAYGEVTRRKGGPAFARAGFFACRLACCAPRRDMGNAPETLAALNAAGALPVILAAAERHRGCRRSASRLLAYLAQGDLAARRLLEEHGAAATMLRVHALEQQLSFGPDKLDVMLSHCPPQVKPMLIAGHEQLQATLKPCLEDSDALAPAAVDGGSLSECDLDDEPVFDPGNVQKCVENVCAAGLSGLTLQLERMTLLTRAVCALTGAPNAAKAAITRSTSAADECAAALLAEEEAEKAALLKKKPKKKKPKKKATSTEVEEASDGDDDEEETAEALGDKALAAGAMRATLVPPPQPFRSPAAALAAQPPPAKPKKAKKKAAPPPEAVKPPPVVAKRPPSPPPPPPPQAPMLPPLPPVQAPPVLPPLPMAAPRVVVAVPLPAPPPAPPMARATSAVEELFPWLAVHDSPPSQPAGPLADAAHEDDELCLVCLDEPRSVALPGCGDAHPPVLCAGCVAWLRRSNAPACPLCRAPLDAPS